MPIFDDETNIEIFLSTFGLEVTYMGMESDDDPAIQAGVERYHAGEINCSFWNPGAPQGSGWMLLEIFENEGRDRKSVVWGKSVSVRVDLGGGGIIKKKIKKT